MNGHVVGGTDGEQESTLQVCEFVAKMDRNGSSRPLCSTNLYVKNFPQPNLSEKQLREMFSKFGELVSVCIMHDAEMNSRQFGFVCFKSASDARAALDFYSSDKENEDVQQQLYVCEAKSKEQRKAELEKKAF